MRKKKLDVDIRKSKRKKKRIILGIVGVFFIVAVVFSYLLVTKKVPTKILNKKTPIQDIIIKRLQIVDEKSNDRPIAVMIDNNVGTSSHVGLQDAYVSYEMIVEGGLTRLMVIFKDKNTAVIGPVRSSRHYFLDYALEHDAIYAHYGWSTFAQTDITKLGVHNINGLYVSSAYWRDRNIAAPHNVFTSIEKLKASASDLSYSLTSTHWEDLNYTTDAVDLTTFQDKTITCQEGSTCNQNPNLIVANQVTIPYSYAEVRSYQYDSSSDSYLRYMNGKAHVDRDSKLQYHYTNIIIEKVANKSIDSYGRQDLSTTGSGDGYYITGGYALPIHWQKDSRSGKSKYTYYDGSLVKLKDGNTFIQIEPIQQVPSFE